MLSELINALHAGKELENPDTWKNRQSTTNAVAAILAGIVIVLRVFGIKLPLDDAQLSVVTAAIVGLLQVANIIITMATSKKVGL